MSVYQFSAVTIDGKEQSLVEYEGKVLLIVNTASKCGFTPQYQGLQQLYETYRDQGLVVLGFPSNQFMNQEPGSNDEIESFCRLNYGVTFPLYAKVDVKGKNIHPLFQYLTKESKGLLTDAVKWNFTKFLIDRKGHVYQRFAPNVNPAQMEADIRLLLEQNGQNHSH